MKIPRYVGNIETVAAIKAWADSALKANAAANLGKKSAIKLLEESKVKFNRMMVLLNWKKQKHEHRNTKKTRPNKARSNKSR